MAFLFFRRRLHSFGAEEVLCSKQLPAVDSDRAHVPSDTFIGFDASDTIPAIITAVISTPMAGRCAAGDLFFLLGGMLALPAFGVGLCWHLRDMAGDIAAPLN